MTNQSGRKTKRLEGSMRPSEKSGERARLRVERGSSRASDAVVLGLGRVLTGLCGLLLVGLVVMSLGLLIGGIDWDSPVVSGNREGLAGTEVRMPAIEPAGLRPETEIVRFDTSKLNDEGLMGSSDGLRSMSYEFCIPATEAHVSEVRAIDATVMIQRSSPGRIGCGETEYLVIGNTHQPRFRKVLNHLAGLSYVSRIEATDFE